MLFQVLIVTPVVLTVIDVHNGEGRRIRVRDLLLLPAAQPDHRRMRARRGRGRARMAAAAAGTLARAGCSARRRSRPRWSRWASSLLGRTADPDRVRAARSPSRYCSRWLIQPCVAFVLAGTPYISRGPILLAVVVCSALPTAQNVFIFARKYGLDRARTQRDRRVQRRPFRCFRSCWRRGYSDRTDTETSHLRTVTTMPPRDTGSGV